MSFIVCIEYRNWFILFTFARILFRFFLNVSHPLAMEIILLVLIFFLEDCICNCNCLRKQFANFIQQEYLVESSREGIRRAVSFNNLCKILCYKKYSQHFWSGWREVLKISTSYSIYSCTDTIFKVLNMVWACRF